MKKGLALLLAVLLLVTLGGCGLKKKAEEKAAEALAEKMLGASGANVDIDGDTVVVEGENGESMTFGSTEWPDSELAALVPEFTGGEITGTMDSTDGVWISIESADASDVEAYFDSVKESFSENAYETTSKDYVAYSAQNADGVTVALAYTEGTLTISVSR